MEKSTLIETLRTFSKEELSKFGDFCASPYHNKKSNVTRLFKALRKSAPDFAPEKITKEEMWKKVFPGKAYNYGIMKNLIYALTKLSEDFLSMAGYRNSSKYDECLIEELYNRNMTGLFTKKIRKYDDELNKEKPRNWYYFSRKSFIMPYLNTVKNADKLVDEERLKTNDVFLKYFLMSYLTNSFHLVVEEQRGNIKHDHSFLLYLLDYFRDKPEAFNESPELRIYFYLMLSYLDIRDDLYFTKAHELFNASLKDMLANDRKNIYNILNTLCCLKEHAGKYEYRKKLLFVFIEMIKNESLSSAKTHYVPLATYRNIVAFASEIEEFGIMRDVISGYSEKTPQENRGFINDYSQAMLLFSRNMFDACAALCSRLAFGDDFSSVSVAFYFKNDIKMLTAKCLYELDSTEVLISLLDAHRHFLKNAAYISEINKLSTVNFVNMLNEMVKLRLNNAENDTKKLMEKLKNTGRLNSRTWLTRKISELIYKKG